MVNESGIFANSVPNAERQRIIASFFQYLLDEVLAAPSVRAAVGMLFGALPSYYFAKEVPFAVFAFWNTPLTRGALKSPADFKAFLTREEPLTDRASQMLAWAQYRSLGRTTSVDPHCQKVLDRLYEALQGDEPQCRDDVQHLRDQHERLVREAEALLRYLG
jgi:ElaB/YqjD/DUF883 family membrane-anchored ribosome-binding protein